MPSRCWRKQSLGSHSFQSLQCWGCLTAQDALRLLCKHCFSPILQHDNVSSYRAILLFYAHQDEVKSQSPHLDSTELLNEVIIKECKVFSFIKEMETIPLYTDQDLYVGSSDALWYLIGYVHIKCLQCFVWTPSIWLLFALFCMLLTVMSAHYTVFEVY